MPKTTVTAINRYKQKSRYLARMAFPETCRVYSGRPTDSSFPLLAKNNLRPSGRSNSGSPSALWTGQQLVNAFPFETAPRFLLRDRDGIYGAEFVRRAASLGMEEKVTAPRSL